MVRCLLKEINKGLLIGTSTEMYRRAKCYCAAWQASPGVTSLYANNYCSWALICSLFLFAEPNFVGSYDIGQYVFFFFRETAVEYINCGKSVYSRVARVCKKDTGGKNILSQNWATYLKARLNCSIPGEFPFYFNEIRKFIGK